jgi:hypothetical protein
LAARLVALLFACAAASGCSAFLLVRPPRSSPAPAGTVACTTSRALPWTDMVLAGLSAVGAAAASTIDCQGSGCDVKAYIVVTPALLMAGYAASSLWGHRAVSDCRDLLARREAPAP